MCLTLALALALALTLTLTLPLTLTLSLTLSSHGVPVASGAYIFSPNSTCHPVGVAARITAVVRGEVVQEVRQSFAPWLTQTVRLAAGWRFAEFEHTVGPVPLSPPCPR